MISKRFEDIEYSDLEALIDNQIAEGKTIEYKKEIVSNASSDKEPFLAGVSAFANTVGGDFIIGIETKDGIPIKLSGANFTNADREILKLEQMLQTGLEPRLPSFNIRDDIQSPTGERFIIVRVNKSWIAPHKVKANEKFYGRNSKGKYPLDVSELRTAFMLSEQITDRIKKFRIDRINKINFQDELPVSLAAGAKVILHLVPLAAFTTTFEFDLQDYYKKNIFLLPLGLGASNRFINLDGVISYSSSVRRENEGYVQLFRNGCLEAVRVFESRLDERKILPSYHLEGMLIQSVTEYKEILFSIGIELPITVFLTLLGVKDYEFAVGESFFDSKSKRPDRDNLILPERIISRQDEDSAETLRPLFDKIWNSYGYLRSFNFDEKGNWKK